MAQVTAKTIDEALRWIETTPHHIGSWIESPGFFVLKGYGETLRIPEAMQAKMLRLIEPGGEFDRRMYRATKSGRARLRRSTAS